MFQFSSYARNGPGVNSYLLLKNLLLPQKQTYFYVRLTRINISFEYLHLKGTIIKLSPLNVKLLFSICIHNLSIICDKAFIFNICNTS